MKNGMCPLRVVETPGLSDSNEGDSKNMIDMVNYLKSKVQKVKLFLLTVNAQESSFDAQTKQLLKNFETSFGPDFWNHMAVAFTHWHQDAPSQKRMQK